MTNNQINALIKKLSHSTTAAYQRHIDGENTVRYLGDNYRVFGGFGAISFKTDGFTPNEYLHKAVQNIINTDSDAVTLTAEHYARLKAALKENRKAVVSFNTPKGVVYMNARYLKEMWDFVASNGKEELAMQVSGTLKPIYAKSENASLFCATCPMNIKATENEAKIPVALDAPVEPMPEPEPTETAEPVAEPTETTPEIRRDVYNIARAINGKDPFVFAPEIEFIKLGAYATFAQWKALGRSVNKGEHGVKITMERNGKPMYYTVFHESQVTRKSGMSNKALEEQKKALTA